MKDLTKHCGRCGLIKPASAFNKDKYASTGLRSQCKLCMVSERQKLKGYYKKWRDNHRSWYASYRRRNSDKVKVTARNAAQYLTKGVCEVCGCKEVHAHHDDYSKPLDVRWLCSPHHIEWHQEHA